MKAYRTLAVALMGTCLAAIGSPVAAQTAQGAPQSTATAGATDDPDAQSSDIIVTANKREERLQDVPISVAVVTGDQIVKQNVLEVTDLTRSTPSLNSAGPFGALSIRGVGSLAFSRSAEGSVGVVVDGVSLANTSTNPPQLFDVARVEILEGPQGTLFGRNSSAGVINVTTVAPDPTKWEVIAHADVGEHNNYIGRGVLNVPIASNAALRLSGAYSQPPQQQYNRFDDSWFRVKGYSGRARFLWEPIDALTINLIGDYSRFDRKGGVPWTVYQSTAGSLLSRRLAACGVVVGPENQQGCTNGGADVTNEVYGFSGQVDAKIGDYTITSISAYRSFESINRASDADSVPVNRLDINASPSNIRNYSQELRLTSPTGGLVDFVAGLYYFDSKLDGSNTQRGQILADLPLALCPIRNPLAPTLNLCPLVTLGQVQTTSASTTSYAAFGNATINLTPSLRLIAGARYGHEDVRAQTTAVLAPGAVAGILPIAPIYGSVQDSYFSYRVGAQFDVTRDVMIYGTYTRGYKGPSVNDQTGTGTVPVIVRPEIPHAGEIGIKANAFDGRLTASLAGFYNRIDDFQAQFFDPTAGAFIFGNAPKLTTKGVSFNLIGRPTRALTLNAGVLYNDATYGDGYLVACAQGQTAAQGCQTLTNGATVDNAGGNRLVGSPKWKATGFAEYVVPVDTAEAFVQADIVYTSRINFDAAFSPQNTNAAATIVGARIGARTQDQRFGVSFFARNIFDVYRPVVRFATPTARQQLDSLSFVQIAGPESRRTLGVSFDARF
jgi:iron complex outermembrane receptor protein